MLPLLAALLFHLLFQWPWRTEDPKIKLMRKKKDDWSYTSKGMLRKLLFFFLNTSQTFQSDLKSCWIKMEGDCLQHMPTSVDLSPTSTTGLPSTTQHENKSSLPSEALEINAWTHNYLPTFYFLESTLVIELMYLEHVQCWYKELQF